MIKSLKALCVAITLLAAPAVAKAADCQLRNLSFVGVLTSGTLVMNAEMWDAGTNTKLGALGNASFCKVNATFNNISSQTCQAWQSTATAAMLAGKKVYLNQTTCQVGNGVTVTTGVLGLNN